MADKKMNDKYSIKLIIITGLSGAGKTEALNYFEDAGYYCIDNLPSYLILNLIKFFSERNRSIDKIAVAIDLRSGYFFDEIYKTLDNLKKKNIKYKILFLEASKRVLMKRFSLTRRKHPLVEDGDVGGGIEKEIEKMHKLRKVSDVIIDTTSLNAKDLRLEITERILGNRERSRLLQISLISFGYKYGLPENADIIMDVRFLPNPFYMDELKDLDGGDEKVVRFVLSRDETKRFILMFEKMMDFLIPNYVDEGKSYLGIGIGCTGGKHRSVVISEKIYEYLKLKGYSIKLFHKDIDKG